MSLILTVLLNSFSGGYSISILHRLFGWQVKALLCQKEHILSHLVSALLEKVGVVCCFSQFATSRLGLLPSSLPHWPERKKKKGGGEEKITTSAAGFCSPLFPSDASSTSASHCSIFCRNMLSISALGMAMCISLEFCSTPMCKVFVSYIDW